MRDYLVTNEEIISTSARWTKELEAAWQFADEYMEAMPTLDWNGHCDLKQAIFFEAERRKWNRDIPPWPFPFA